MSINIVAITGRLVRDPELRQTTSGISVCSFSVAVDRPYKSGEERQADFVDCVAWRGSADFLVRYFRKGDMIGIQGHIQTRNFETKDGQKRKATEIVVECLSFAGGKRTDKPTEGTPSADAPAFAELSEEDSRDLPF